MQKYSDKEMYAVVQDGFMVSSPSNPSKARELPNTSNIINHDPRKHASPFVIL